ncbi:MAG: glycosyltransferase family 4 protein [Anaerolineae bacterium]|nr:glycosyltransferase family 4 protein [Anaerolineae bacterium]
MTNQPIRLLLVTKSTGGVAAYIRMLVQNLNREKFKITVACLSENGPEFAAELKTAFGVSAFSLAMNRYKVNPFTDTRVLIQLASHIRREKYDLIHAHASKAGFLMRMAAIGTGIPVIYSPHNFAFHEGSKPVVARVVALLEALIVNFTAKIITVAAHERELALRYGVGVPELYEVIPTGIDPAPYRLTVDVVALKTSLSIPASARVVGAVGRLAVPKLPNDFVRMAASLHETHPDVHFVWVGSGPLEAGARDLARQLHVENIVHWLGHRTDVNHLYKMFDCFVLLSKWEGNPLVVLEAFAAGVPVIAFDNLGTHELIGTGNHGILIPIGDWQALARAIANLLDHPAQASEMSRLAGEQLEHDFTLDGMMRKIETVYLEKAMSL